MSIVKRYNNYHRHTHYSNIRTPDVIVKPEDYIKRAKELGHTTYFTTEHGCSGNVFEAYELCKKNKLKCIFGTEMYYADDRYNKEDRKNYHIIVIGLTKNAYYQINRVLSEANKTGFYYHPRADMELLLSLPAKEVIITSACIGGRLFKTDNYISEFVLPLKNHFGSNFMLEVQDHNHPKQIEWNESVLNLSTKYNIPIIHGCDSHYIKPGDAKYRTLFLKGKGMNYGDEDSFILDYPDYNTIVDNYKKQGVLSDKEIEVALESTLIFDKAEDLKFNSEMKMPTIYPNKDKDKILRKIIKDKWKKEKKHIDKALHKKYKNEIYNEMSIIEKTNTADYFLLNERIIDRAVNKHGGVLTRTGRGCFTEDSLVHTENEIKSIKDIKTGDKVITESGEFNSVLNTMKYEIEEDLIQIKHIYGTDKYYPTICTLDHKILINRDDKVNWIEAGDIKHGDFVCTPKIELEDRLDNTIDLNDYNDFGYDYDDKYIYEMSPYFNDYIEHNPTEISKKIGAGKSLFERYANGEHVSFTRKPWLLERFFEHTPFKSQEEYVDYIRNSRTRKINRFINLDEEFNIFIGLMYGDGSAPKNRSYTIGLATHSENDDVNKQIFYNVANRLNIPVTENQSKTKKLLQLYMNSNIFSSFVRKDLFISEKGADKIFNSKWFYQNKENLSGLVHGLRLSDGSFKSSRISFDNTSKSIINAYKLLCLMTGEGVNSMSVRRAHIMKGGYKCKESYKLRINANAINNPKHKERIKEDDKYWYLPVKETVILPNQKTTVYDIEVENEHSYLLNNMIVHNSAPSFYINKLLGFTNIDRINAPVPLYPTRFMTVARILESGQMPDIDFNFAQVEPAIKASKEILGEDNVYYMVAYGTMQESAAFRNLCRGLDLDVQAYNEVAKNLDQYKNDEKWGKIIEESKKFIGVIDSIAPSPCSFLLLNKPISEEIGLIRVGDELCASIDGYTADKWGYLKNDLLTVSVWKLISQTFNLIDKPIPTIKELDEMLDDKVWDLYANGITATLNQVDSEFATSLMKSYKAKNVSELSAFVAAIRPGFASLLNHFINREKYTTHVKELDDVLQDSFHYLLYQESIMKMLIWCGIQEDKTYDIIKKIAKKVFKTDELAEFKSTLREGFIKNTGSDEWFNEVWQVVEDAVRYSFNASHSVSVAYDSLYGAYLKANYPLEYYKVALDHYNDDERRTNNLINELEYFNIKLKPIKFRYSSAEYTLNKKENAIYKGIASIKYLNAKVADEIYELKDNRYESFYKLLIDLKEKTSLNSRQLEILITFNFFDEFGYNKTLLKFNSLFDKLYGKKQLSKIKAKDYNLNISVIEKYSRQTEKTYMDLQVDSILKYELNNMVDEKLSLKEQVKEELKYLGYIDFKEPRASLKFYIVSSFKTYNDKRKPYITLYQLKTGNTIRTKVTSPRYFEINPFELYDILKVKKFKTQKKWKNPNETEQVLFDWQVI